MEINSAVNHSDDLVARYGGEEFIVILAETSPEEAKAVSETIRRKIEEIAIEHKTSIISDYALVSIGTSTAMPVIGEDQHELIKLTAETFYLAKNAGRNQVFSNNMNEGYPYKIGSISPLISITY